MRHANWDCCIRCPDSNSHNHISSRMRMVVHSHRLPIIRAFRRRRMNRMAGNECTSVVASPVSGPTHCSMIIMNNFETNRKYANISTIVEHLFCIVDMETHHHRIRSERMSNRYSPDRNDNDSPGKCYPHFYHSTCMCNTVTVSSDANKMSIHLIIVSLSILVT